MPGQEDLMIENNKIDVKIRSSGKKRQIDYSFNFIYKDVEIY